jgi:hypothetical protein
MSRSSSLCMSERKLPRSIDTENAKLKRMYADLAPGSPTTPTRFGGAQPVTKAERRPGPRVRAGADACELREGFRWLAAAWYWT